MKNENSIRQWATPLTTGAFALTAITGIMLFFHIQVGMVKLAHEWLSWIFVIGVVFHVIINRHVFMKYFSKPLARGIMIAFVVLIAVSLLPLGGGQKKNPMSRVTDSVLNAPLTEVAVLSNHPAGDMMNLLRSKGIYVERQDQSIKEIAALNKTNPMRVIDAIF